LYLTEGSQLVTTTSSTGKAGDITVNTTENVLISGIDPTFIPPVPRTIQVANPSPLEEIEPNDSIDQAQKLDTFFLNSPDNVNPNVEFSTRIPYVSIAGIDNNLDENDYQEDYYSFEVTEPGTIGIFDVDRPEGADAHTTQLYLDCLCDGQRKNLAFNGGASPSLGAGGSQDHGDPYIKYVFSEPGTYFIDLYSQYYGNYYNLQVSLETPNIARGIENGVLASGLFARSEGAGVAGNVQINTPQLSVVDGGNISATATAAATQFAQGGNINVNASNVNLSGSNSGLFAQTQGAASAGSLTLKPFNNEPRLTINLADGAEISASTSSHGQGGNLIITAPEEVTIRGNGQLSVETSAAGSAGEINISTETLNIEQGARVSATATATATTSESNGSLNLNTSHLNLSGQNSGLFAQTQSAAPAGSLTLQPFDNGQDLTINFADGAEISASTFNSGQGGNLIITAPEAVTIQGNGQLSVETDGTGSAGNVEINTSHLTIQDTAQISASTSNIGKGGSVQINSTDSVFLNNQGRLLTESTGTGVSGNLTINTRQLTLQQDSQISAATNSAPGGDIDLQRLESLELTDNSAISTSTQIGQAGSISVNANSNPANSVRVSDNSRLEAQATAEEGNAGEILLNTQQLRLENEGKVSAANISGESQGISLQGLQTLELFNDSEISASTQRGQAGSVTVNEGENSVESVSLNNSRLSVEATGEGGKAGGVTINTQQLSLSEDSQLSASNISGESQDIILQGLENVQLTNGSEISASTQTGTAGSLSINQGENPVESVSVNNSRLSVEATSEGGKAGGVTINTEQLTLEERSQLSASNISGESQDIILQGLDTLEVNNSLISASTQSGKAGSLSVNATESVDLTGVGGLSVEATNGGTAGNLTANTRQMSVRDGAAVTVSSPFGQAGNLTIQANSLILDQGQLTAETGFSGIEGGANIRLSDLNTLLMTNESRISAKASGDANGGNIDINTTFLIAQPPEGVNGSDIIASAERGDGGRITITGEGIFGIQERPAIDGNRTNDIDASSQFGAPGEVELNAPLDPNRGLIELPSTLVDPTGQINRSCAVVTENGVNSFTVTGRGGLPLSPDEVLPPDTVVEDLGTLVSHPGTSAQPDAGTMDNLSVSNPQPPKQIIEAQGWIKTADGQIILVAEVPPTNYQGNWQNPTHCVATDE
jgi:large exoprotein involved in heme utilization and adhesion